MKEFVDTELGPLPADWCVMPLSQATLRTQTYDPRNTPEKRFRYIDVASVSNETYRILGWSELRGQDAPSRARKIVQCGDTIFATVRPYLRNIAHVQPELDDSICSTGFCVIRANRQKAEPYYLYYVVLYDNFITRVVELQRGSSYPAVSDKDVLGQPIPLPPLPEQRRIAAVLNAIQDAIAAQEDVIAAARQFKRSLMQRLFTYGPGREPAVTKETEIGEIPAHWEVVKLGHVATLQRGYDLPKQNRKAGSVPIVTSSGISGTHIEAKVRGPGVVTGRYGTLGDVYFIKSDFWPHNTTLFVNDFHGNYPRFVARLLERTQLGALNDKTSVPGINRNHAHQLSIGLPPIAEQKIIDEMLNVTDAKIAAEEDRKTALDALFKSMLHQLMTGQIRLLADEGLPPVI